MRRVTRGKALIGGAGISTITSGGTSLVLAALADGAGTTVTFTCSTNATFGDFVLVTPSLVTTAGLNIYADMSGAGTVSCRFQNESGGTVSMGTATYNYLILRK